MAAMTSLMEAARDTLQFLLPRQCAGCGVDDAALCVACTHALSNRSRLVQLAIARHLFQCPVVAVSDYNPRARAIVTAFKDKGMHPLASPLATAMADAWSRYGVSKGTPVLVIPVPSARGGKIRRGYEPTWLLACELAQRIPLARSAKALQRTGKWGGRQRKTLRRRERLIATPRYLSRYDVRGYSVVIVDDVVTTGASLEAAAHALTDAGAQVLGAIVVASAARESRPSPEAENCGDTALATRLRLRPSQADS